MDVKAPWRVGSGDIAKAPVDQLEGRRRRLLRELTSALDEQVADRAWIERLQLDLSGNRIDLDDARALLGKTGDRHTRFAGLRLHRPLNPK